MAVSYSDYLPDVRRTKKSTEEEEMQKRKKKNKYSNEVLSRRLNSSRSIGY